MQDSITREITVKADPARVYAAMTDPKQIVSWLPDAVTGDLAVGKQSTFTFEGYGESSVYVVDAKPNEYFAYRWIPGGAHIVDDLLSVATTLVEFFITNVDDGTKVVIKESGFAALPADIAKASFTENSGGWDFMVGRLEKVLG